MTIAVVGIGYVGLPLAVTFAEAGIKVLGIDADERKVDLLNEGVSYIEDISSSRLRPLVRKNMITAVSNFERIAVADVISICVPTPLGKTGDPDISHIVSTSEQLSKHLRKGQIVVLESTTYPGTTREVILPILSSGGLTVGEDFYLAFSPERVDPGRKDFTTKNTPKILGGVTEKCLIKASEFYGKAIDKIVAVSNPETAEMVKLLENTFRAVNIGLVNEVFIMCEVLGVNAWEVIDAAATKPFGFMKFMPGPGLGGHCIPVDPHYLSWKLKTLNYKARFIDLASEVNTSMPRYWVGKVQDRLNSVRKSLSGSSILVIGVTYKKDVADTRESPALDIIKMLTQKGAFVSYHDPNVPLLNTEGISKESVNNLYEAIEKVDCVVIVTDHSEYDWNVISGKSTMIVDTRNVTGMGAQ